MYVWGLSTFRSKVTFGQTGFNLITQTFNANTHIRMYVHTYIICVHNMYTIVWHVDNCIVCTHCMVCTQSYGTYMHTVYSVPCKIRISKYSETSLI